MVHPSVDIPQAKSFFLRIKAGDQEAFKVVFDLYYRHLVLFALRYMGDKDLAENIVQNVFVKLWEKRTSLDVDSVKAYLIVSVKNQCRNELKHSKIVREYESRQPMGEEEPEPDFPDPEVLERINRAIEEMPEQRKRIFKMNRVDGMRYKEIAETLHISPKTVEVQIGKALKYLRDNLYHLKSRVYQHN
ncbi:MAG: RNA polymerase sigma-70 factor [Breznakibacter sp.]